ncbi:alpha/beta hydrolase [Eudoraea chungangensis]|uniref:alpha/beta hydrolase n=1 Tax=Eudoraea chungangensis TaxID=1481905 RepID=UPI0023EC56A6|nr:alpha/beta hydrolase [Eudoraea chungangensis]
MKPFFLFLTLVLAGNLALQAQDTIVPLWPRNNVPNRIPSDEKEMHKKDDILLVSQVQYPEIEVYFPSERSNNGKAVLVFPGGGYHVLAYDWEGTDIAKFLNSKGIVAIVVKYRLPVSKSLENPKMVPLQDAQRAIRLVRHNALNWNIDENLVGVMGFSAGGHLASTLGTHYNEEAYEALDVVDAVSARPDFMALVYPVISFTSSSKHSGSLKALLGENPSLNEIRYFSNELQVNQDTPPTILFHATDDKGVPPANSLLFYTSLVENNVSAELHIFPEGGHGFALAIDRPYLHRWTEILAQWIQNL